MKTQQPLTTEKFKNIYSKVPRLCVDVLIKTGQGILMTLRDIEPYKNFWHIPGGTVYYGETIEKATKRIAREELGVDVDVEGLVGYTEYPSEQKLRGYGWTIALQMSCAIKSGKFKLDRQAREIKFFKKDNDIPENTVEEHKKFLKKMLKEMVSKLFSWRNL